MVRTADSQRGIVDDPSSSNGGSTNPWWPLGDERIPFIAMNYDRLSFMRDWMHHEGSTANMSANGAFHASPGQRPGNTGEYFESPEWAP